MQRFELDAGAWVTLTEGWLAADEAGAIFACMLRELSWEQRHIVLFGRRVLQPRLIAWAGELPYRYSGQTLEPRAWPGLVGGLLERVNASTGACFNHVLINRYRDGKDSMGYHADAEPELGPDPIVATVSLGAPRRFVLRRHEPRRAPMCADVRRPQPREAPLVMQLVQGSLLVMGGTCQRQYRHAIPRENGDTRERVSLTFRRLLSAPPRTGDAF